MNLLAGVFGVLALAGALGVVTCRRPVHSALSLVGNIAALAVMFLLLNAQFLFAVQLIIYAGAVVVLFVFIIALLNPDREERPVVDGRLLVGVAGVVAITVAVLLVARNGITVSPSGLRGAQVGAATGPAECPPEAPERCHDPYQAFGFTPDQVNADGAGNVQTAGGQLFTTFLLPFEATSLLLLVAAIGAVYLTRRPAEGIPIRRGAPHGAGRAVPPLGDAEPAPRAFQLSPSGRTEMGDGGVAG